MMETLAVWTVGALILFVSRNIYRYSAPNAVSRDAYVHLMYIDDIEENNHRIPDSPSHFATGGYYAYPFLVHWLLSYLPRWSWGIVDRYFSGILDVAFSVLFLLLAIAEILSPLQLGLVLILFIATPEFARPDLSHGKGLSARKPGILFTTASALSFLLWLNTGLIGFVFISILFGAFVALSSKFGLQATLAIFISLGGFSSPIAFTIPLLSILTAVILSRGAYIRVLVTHLRHSRGYAKNYSTIHAGSNVIAPDGSVFSFVTDLSDGNISKADLNAIRERTIVRVLVNNPYLVILVFAAILHGRGNLPLPIGTYPWIAGGVFALILTSLPSFRFLGEAERYLEYIFLPSAIVIVSAWDPLGTIYQLVIVGFVGLGIAILVFYYFAYSNVIAEADESREALQGVITFLRQQSPGTVIVQPVNDNGPIALETDHSVVDIGINASSTPDVVDERDKLYEFGKPYITDDLDWLKERYNPAWVVFEREKQPYNGLKPASVEPAFENERFEVYRFSSYDTFHPNHSC